MNKTILTSAFVLASLVGCSQHTEPAPVTQNVKPMCISKSMPGGWSQSEITPEVEQAVVTVISQMNSSSKLKQINDVRTQVVNGVNYAIEFTLENGEVWNTVVFRNLRNDYMIEQIAKQGPLCPK
ncbi:hypothetical protein VISI1226_10617 [Vibrio sinaloensis DSM 21326]|uniref:Cystatin domain-containing protein n=1 Tax=Vibrio sinaloensis DSM 21326 TaxID=945550 RepID=E8MAU5_PHOS4|nr:cystatin domain-containing protein [Vibrio sinaloensis]EGA68775.1 hypothetical protein VISI1226_10617 [Vibrio sinaloensis DSM 21326]